MPCRVILDGRALSGPRNGWWRFANGLVDGLRHDGQEAVEVWSDHPPIEGDVAVKVVPRHAWRYALTAAKGVVFHDLTSGRDLGWLANVKVEARLVVTVHDVIPSLLAENGSDAEYLVHTKLVCAKAAAIATVSESSRRDILQRLDVPPEKVTVIYPGVRRFRSVGQCEARKQAAWLGIKARDVVVTCVGIDREYKNLSGMMYGFRAAARRIGRDARLLVVGHASSRVIAMAYLEAARLNVASQVVFAGRVTDEELGVLYNCSDVLLHASRVEGFGLPPLEAAVCGIPIVVSDIPVFRELADGLAVFVEPDEPLAIAEGLLVALEKNPVILDHAARLKHKLSVLTWDACASGYRRLYEAIGEV